MLYALEMTKYIPRNICVIITYIPWSSHKVKEF